MVLPLLIIGAIVIGGGILAYKGGNQVAEGFNRLTKTDARKQLEVEKDRHQFEAGKRGFFDNAYAALFGETALNESKKDTKPTATKLGNEPTTPQRYRTRRSTRATPGRPGGRGASG